jgi:hypothetical protein
MLAISQALDGLDRARGERVSSGQPSGDLKWPAETGEAT